MSDYTFPTTLEHYTQEVRGTIMDHPELNRALLLRDSGDNDFDNKDLTDAEIQRALRQGLAVINAFPPVTRYTFQSFPSETHYFLLVDQAVVRLLMMKGILHTRNDMPYQDGGGVTVDMRGKGREYLSIAQMFYQMSMEQLKTFKYAQSVRQGWGGVMSEYGAHYYGW